MADTTTPSTSSVFEYRGVDNLYYAEITKDESGTNGVYTTGTPQRLAYVAEIGKTVETNSEAKYYDNKPMIVLNSEGATTLTITCAPLPLDVLAKITGKKYDSTNNALYENVRDFDSDFAIGYRTKDTRGKYRYVWHLKGSFGVPDETFATENAGTDTNNMTLTFTSIMTTHEFTTDGIGSVKSIVVDGEKNENVSTDNFFGAVITPDNIAAQIVKATTGGGTTTT